MQFKPGNIYFQKIGVIFFFGTVLALGLFIYPDYGISIDEIAQREDNGLVNYQYISDHEASKLYGSNEKYHGPAFEILLIEIEKLFSLTHSREIYLIRHLVVFLTFFIGLIFFYRAQLQFFFNRFFSILGCAMLLLSPRIFADAFYNSKDIPFMSFLIISFYTSLRLHQKPTPGRAFLHAIITAFLIDIRILGVIVPLFDLAVILIRIITTRKLNLKKIIPLYFFYFIALTAGVITFWPALWNDTYYNFSKAFGEMRRYHWSGMVTFCGKVCVANELPWYYIPWYIIITTPLFYILLFLIGSVVSVINFITNIKQTFSSNLPLTMVLYLGFAPLISVILFHSVVYDGWRHLYFIYPFIVLIAVNGLKYFYSRVNSKWQIVLSSFLFLFLFETAFSMYRIHPYQNAYFNQLEANKKTNMTKYYEPDYWGLAFTKGLENILAIDTSRIITVYGNDGSYGAATLMLTGRQRSRIWLAPVISEADYYLTNYRFENLNFRERDKVFSITADGINLLDVFEVKNNLLADIDPKSGKPYIFFKNDFEKNYLYWHNNFVTSDSTGNHLNTLTKIENSSATLNLRNDTCLVFFRNKKVITRFYSPDLIDGSSADFGIAVQTRGRWLKKQLLERVKPVTDMPGGKGVWEAELKMPGNVNYNDKITFFIWNSGGRTFSIDNLTFAIYPSN